METASLWGFATFVAILLIYFWFARRAHASRQIYNPENFFISKTSHTEAEYSSSQIGYSLQMATIYPYFLFSIFGAWWLGVWNVIFYAIGITLFRWSISKFSKGSTPLVGESKTIHNFIA